MMRYDKYVDYQIMMSTKNAGKLGFSKQKVMVSLGFSKQIQK